MSRRILMLYDVLMNINPVAFRIGGLEVRWYGLIITCAMVLGLIILIFMAKKKGISSDDTLELFMWVIKLGTVFARILYVCQAIGRWGNFCNQEAYGQLVTNEKLFGLPLSVYIDAAHAVNGAGWYQATFLYESVYNFIGAILTYCLWRKNKVNGALVFFYGVWYCVIRLILDFLRVDGLLSTKIACVIVIPTFTALGIWYYLHGLKKLDHDKAALEVEEMLASDD